MAKSVGRLEGNRPRPEENKLHTLLVHLSDFLDTFFHRVLDFIHLDGSLDGVVFRYWRPNKAHADSCRKWLQAMENYKAAGGLRCLYDHCRLILVMSSRENDSPGL
jgi:hypothetical protein